MPDIQHVLFWAPSTKQMTQTEESSKVPWKGFSSGTYGEVRRRAFIAFVCSRMRILRQGDPPAISHLMERLREGRKRHWPETHNENQEVTVTVSTTDSWAGYKGKGKHQTTGLGSLCTLSVLALFQNLPGEGHEQPEFTFNILLI